MVNVLVTNALVSAAPPEWAAAERRLLLAYAPPTARSGAAALLELDDVMSGVLRSTTQPMIGQIRLTWWHEALSALDAAPPPAHPLLVALAAIVKPGGVTGAELARLVEGWEELLDPELLDAAALGRFATLRGAGLFDAIARVLGATGDPVRVAGEGWALADLAQHTSDATLAKRAAALAQPHLDGARRHRWSRPGRMLGAMTHLAGGSHRTPAQRTARALWHRITGS